jgi:hypothetical protein
LSQQLRHEGASQRAGTLMRPVASDSIQRRGSCRRTESELIADIRRVARLLRHSPSSVEYARFGRYHVRTLQRRFDTSWRGIVEAAGLRYTSRTSRRIPTTEELREDVRRVASEIGHPPTRRDYDHRGEFGPETIRRRTGEKKWEHAVASLTGFDHEDIKSRQRKGGCYRTTKEWLAKLRELSQKLGHAPTTREANQAGINAHELGNRVGGKWVEVLKAAGIDLNSRSRYAALRSTTTLELLEDVVRVSRRLGRPAKVCEYSARGHYSYTAISRRLGGWRQVKRVVGERLAEERDHGVRKCVG